MMSIPRYLLAALCCLAFTASCNRDREITVPAAPEISFEGNERIFKVKIGQTLRITPVVANAGKNATYVWKTEGVVIGTESSLTYRTTELGNVYVDFRVSNDHGTAEESLRIDVVSLLSPQIVMSVPEDGFTVVVGGELRFAPEVENSQNAEYAWTVDGNEKSDQKDYTFSSPDAGDYTVAFTAENEDGKDVLQFNVKVRAPGDMPFQWMWETETFNLSVGRTAYIRSYWITNAFDAVYSWRIDDGEVVQEGPRCLLAYTPSGEGTSKVTVTMNNSYGEVSKIFTVNAWPPEGTYRRPAGGESSADADHGYFFLPAPGQHINRGTSVTAFGSQQEVDTYIYDRPGSTEYGGSLGAWGGYLVVGFDHSVENNGGYDLEIEGNAYQGSSEPGIVWVMQDENGNGLPDDTWYELKGSAYQADGYARDYAVTYFRGADRKAIAWSDNRGNVGTVSYIHIHTPATMYPRWLGSQSYTLVGSRLPSRTVETSPGYWKNEDFEWGYVDNWSTVDMLTRGENENSDYVGNRLRISDAITYEGAPANLQYIDFVKIQTGVNMTAGWLGESSTEVGGIRDYNMIE